MKLLSSLKDKIDVVESLSKLGFARVCSEFYDLLRKSGEFYIPGRLLASIYYNIELLNINLLEKILSRRNKDEFLGALKAYAYGLHRLLSESDRDAMPLFTKILKERGEVFLTEKLAIVPETAGLLFPASQNIEPYSAFLESTRVLPENLANIIVKTSINIEKNVLVSNESNPDDKAYTALHLSRALAEVSRTAYSMGLQLEESRRLLGCRREYPIHQCLLDKAIKLANMVFDGAMVPDIPVLGYIQITSTVTRTDLWNKRLVIATSVGGHTYAGLVKKKMAHAKELLNNMNIRQLARYEALSLEGSYYYNSGWLSAIEGRFDEAGNNFRQAYRSFFVIQRDNTSIPLGFFRGVYVSLWNYYLMWLDHSLIHKGEPDDEILDDAKCWGEKTREILLDPPVPGMIWKLGTHAFYAYVLSIVASYIKGLTPEIDAYIVKLAPERIRAAIRTIEYLYKDRLDSAIEAAKKAGFKPLIIDLLKAMKEGRAEGYMDIMSNDKIIWEMKLTVREKPVVKYIVGKLANGVNVREGIVLLALYTL